MWSSETCQLMKGLARRMLGGELLHPQIVLHQILYEDLLL